VFAREPLQPGLAVVIKLVNQISCGPDTLVTSEAWGAVTSQAGEPAISDVIAT
jgi:hypothetical protein